LAFCLGMYCLNGTTPGYDDNDTNAIVNPLFNACLLGWTVLLPSADRRVIVDQR
jgi:hypothetical protein